MMTRLFALLALLVAFPLAGQSADTMRIREPVTITVIPEAGPIVVVDTVEVVVIQVDTVYAGSGICREREKTRERSWFSWSDWDVGDWEIVDCPGEVIPDPGEPEPEPPTDTTPDPPTDTVPEPPTDTVPAPPDTVPTPPDTVPTDPSPPAGQGIDWSDYSSASAFWAGPGSQTSPSGGRYEIVNATVPDGATRAMRMTFLASQSTSDMGVGFRDYPIQGRPREVWIEFYARFENGFTTSGPESGGTDWKFLFLFDQQHSGSWRWAHHLGVFGSETQLRLSGATPLTPRASDIFDGQWHRFRYHARMDSPGRWCWGLDARPMECLTATDLDRGSQYYFNDFSVGRTFNRGVARDQWYMIGPVRIYTSNPGW